MAPDRVHSSNTGQSLDPGDLLLSHPNQKSIRDNLDRIRYLDASGAKSPPEFLMAEPDLLPARLRLRRSQTLRPGYTGTDHRIAIQLDDIPPRNKIRSRGATQKYEKES
jgi:hypothetical protein